MTAPYYSDDLVTLYHGDCRDVLATLPDASVDAVVTDPPYELGFMGKAWDASGIAYSVPMWSEVFRVLKPGGHLLSFGGTRTWHRMVCAVEDAGFEVRDCLGWLYGSGFPKSLDVSKAIDKAGGVSPERQAAILRDARERAGMSREAAAAAVGCTPSSLRDWEEGRARAVGRPREFITPSEDYRLKLADLLGYTADERRVVGTGQGSRGHYESGHRGIAYATAPATPDAERWQGWGTALKPAWEPICVARKPLVGTVAANVLEHGTGALNIDGCRVASGADYHDLNVTQGATDQVFGGGKGLRSEPSTFHPAAGRWPANVVLDEDAAAALDEQSGTAAPKVARSGKRGGSEWHGKAGFGSPGQDVTWPADDGGGASRFFYVAKAPTHERPKVDGKAHATVKPLTLMRWLVRLVTPPGGTVLDPFAGSGTTAEACVIEGFHCQTIEADSDHLPLIVQRLSKPIEPTLFGAIS